MTTFDYSRLTAAELHTITAVVRETDEVFQRIETLCTRAANPAITARARRDTLAAMREALSLLRTILMREFVPHAEDAQAQLAAMAMREGTES